LPKIHNKVAPSGRDDWTTPLDFYMRLRGEFNFRLDAAASAFNQLCPKINADSLVDPWDPGPVFCNPPYGRIATPLWLTRGISEFKRTRNTTVFLLPAAVETKWFQEIAAREAHEIRLIKGRLTFGNVLCKDGTIGECAAPFPSCLVILQDSWRTYCKIRTWDWRKE
jgi:phage N-6-adenine-methyltransferase